jgi:hypothetical protein
MANLNYERRLMNLNARRFDEQVGKADLSESYGKFILPKNLEYLIESMRPIEKKYNDVTLVAAENVKKHLERDLSLHFNRAYRTQGSVKTSTNIKLHSDIDLLVLVDRYQFLEPALCPPQYPYTDSIPDDDIWSLRRQSTTIMQNQYDDVDTTGKKSISITNKNLRRKVDLVFSFWYDTQRYSEANDEFYRGICLYDFPAKKRLPDFPFAHISNVNWKGENTLDGSRKGIRLVKTLKADSEDRIKLSSFELTCLVHAIENSDLFYRNREELKIAISISSQIGKMLSDSVYRKSIKSPNATEKPFDNDDCLSGLRNLKEDLDQLIKDCAGELNNFLTKRSLSIY